jgi:hypothetical protein
MLYNDLFSGQLDTEVQDGDLAYLRKAYSALKKVPDGQYKHIFETAIALTNVTLIKYDMGVKLRAAYKKRDKSALSVIVKDMDTLLRRLKKFEKLLQKQWMIENKPYGYEIQEYRLGGLMLRIKNCKARVKSFLNGEIESIPELEETLVPDVLLGKNPHTGRQGYNSFELIASVNNF